MYNREPCLPICSICWHKPTEKGKHWEKKQPNNTKYCNEYRSSRIKITVFLSAIVYSRY